MRNFFTICFFLAICQVKGQLPNSENFPVKELFQTRWLTGLHTGYDFSFYKFSIRFQVGTYLGDDKGKGAFFLRPALRYSFSKKFFAQTGLKTLAGGAADYIEYGIGFKPFLW